MIPTFEEVNATLAILWESQWPLCVCTNEHHLDAPFEPRPYPRYVLHRGHQFLREARLWVPCGTCSELRLFSPETFYAWTLCVPVWGSKTGTWEDARDWGYAVERALFEGFGIGQRRVACFLRDSFRQDALTIEEAARRHRMALAYSGRLHSMWLSIQHCWGWKLRLQRL